MIYVHLFQIKQFIQHPLRFWSQISHQRRLYKLESSIISGKLKQDKPASCKSRINVQLHTYQHTYTRHPFFNNYNSFHERCQLPECY